MKRGIWLDHQCKRPDPNKVVRQADRWACAHCGRIWQTRRLISAITGGWAGMYWELLYDPNVDPNEAKDL